MDPLSDLWVCRGCGRALPRHPILAIRDHVRACEPHRALRRQWVERVHRAHQEAQAVAEG